MAESDKLDNTHEGLMTGDVEDWTSSDPRKFGPNGKAPHEVHPTSFVLAQRGSSVPD
jgi:hypothetical protein